MTDTLNNLCRSEDTMNKDLWDRVKVTNPDAVKPITGKQYKGNSPKPYWLIERATDEFGPCGRGWGVEIVSERFERFGDEALHVAHVRVWYILDDKRGEIEQMGQTKAAYTSAAGKYIVDEDAPKKSVTDGMVKCLSMLGFAGDIFSGQWDDSKYVAQARAHYAEPERAPIITSKTGDVVEIDPDRARMIQLAASIAIQRFKKGDEVGAYEEVSGITDSDEKLFLWHACLGKESGLRAVIKRLAHADRETV